MFQQEITNAELRKIYPWRFLLNNSFNIASGYNSRWCLPIDYVRPETSGGDMLERMFVHENN
jgi:hypothetical protein